MKCKIFFVVLAVVLCFVACSKPNQPPLPDNSAELERKNTFDKFQEYVNSKYSGWTVEAFKDDSIEIATDLTEKHYYYLALTNGKENKIVFVVMADFTLPDGTTETKIYEPSDESVNQLRNEKAVQKNKEQEESLNEQQEEPASYRP